VLILPPGHAQRVAARRQFSTREKWILSGVGALTAALIIAVVISLATAEPKSGHGCVYVTVSSSMGAQPFSGCGAKGRQICAEVGRPGGYTGSLERALIPACRQAGLPTAAKT
jgi:hypothetical protein